MAMPTVPPTSAIPATMKPSARVRDTRNRASATQRALRHGYTHCVAHVGNPAAPAAAEDGERICTSSKKMNWDEFRLGRAPRPKVSIARKRIHLITFG